MRKYPISFKKCFTITFLLYIFYFKNYSKVSILNNSIANVDSLDWKDYGSDAIVDKVLNHSHLGNGSIILMHNGAKYTPEALDAIITGLKSKGYELVPISQLIKKDQFHLNHEGRQISD